MKQSDKFRQANKEALATCVATLAIVGFWWLAGFGLSESQIKIYSTPLWVWGGCVGTWIFACIVVLYLTKNVFKDFSLDAEEEQHE